MQTAITISRPCDRSRTKDGLGSRPLPVRPELWRGYDIRPARTSYQQGEASMLVKRMYAWRGYTTKADEQAQDDPNRITLNAWLDSDLAATLTLGRDSPAGLLADTLYAQELENLRRADRVVCEVSRLAVNPDLSSGHLLTSLFHAALQYGKELFAASDAVIEVNPRHATYYQRRYGFQQIGDLRQCPRVDAPAVLLHQELDGILIPSGEFSWI